MSRQVANLKAWLLREADGEAIEAVVIGRCDADYNGDPLPRYSEQPKCRVLTWDEAAPWLDYDFDDSYGSAGCNAVYAWTASKVITISEYDGATSCEFSPRHPIQCEPEYR